MNIPLNINIIICKINYTKLSSSESRYPVIYLQVKLLEQRKSLNITFSKSYSYYICKSYCI